MRARGARRRQEGLWHELRLALEPIAAYWVFLVAMFGAFALAVGLTDPSPGAIGAVLILGFTTAAGVAVGQLMALLRVRDWLVYVFAIVWWTLGFIFSAALTAGAGALGGVAGLVVFLLPFFLTGGLWSLRTGRALFSAWVPLIYASGTAILIAESSGKVEAWKGGQKWAVWDVFTFGVLVVGIVLLLAFLFIRETHRLALWRSGPRGPLLGSVAESGASKPRLTLLGWGLLCALAFGVALGSAALAPYLWRTGPDEDGGGASAQAQDADGPPKTPLDPSDKGERARPREGEQKKRRQRRGSGEDSDLVDVREDARPEERGAGGVMIDPLLLLVLALLGLTLGGLPARRLLLVARLREPEADRSATARIEGWWRLLEIGLTDAGLDLRPGEPPARMLARAAPVLREIHPLDLAELTRAAEIRDRVAYGLGVDPADLSGMEELAVTAYDALWDRLGDRAQIRAMYRLNLSGSADEFAP